MDSVVKTQRKAQSEQSVAHLQTRTFGYRPLSIRLCTQWTCTHSPTCDLLNMSELSQTGINGPSTFSLHLNIKQSAAKIQASIIHFKSAHSVLHKSEAFADVLVATTETSGWETTRSRTKENRVYRSQILVMNAHFLFLMLPQLLTLMKNAGQNVLSLSSHTTAIFHGKNPDPYRGGHNALQTLLISVIHPCLPRLRGNASILLPCAASAVPQCNSPSATTLYDIWAVYLWLDHGRATPQLAP